MDALSAALRIAGSGLEAQSARLRVVSENIANAQSTGKAAGSDPYQRKTISFGNELERTSDVYKRQEMIHAQGPTPLPRSRCASSHKGN